MEPSLLRLGTASQSSALRHLIKIPHPGAVCNGSANLRVVAFCFSSCFISLPLWCVARSQGGTTWVAALRHWQLRKLNSEAESVKSMTKSVLFFCNNWNNIIILRLNFYCWWISFQHSFFFFAFSLYQDPFKYILRFLIFIFLREEKDLSSVGHC